ncbi:conserved protein, unknown function [Plasmodium berghei ANKA]|uniref:SUEL-type lectin domain-containing protein n=1 Tax=Plasmodium berghei (strain Anka) TaxID=5823 RepID=A0A509AR36_PLABA|nr:conserved protein, unknown function [Plasmodium berghei ANKA]VUC57810.1 conserved protein, unknown function [Plasmodium berghei ANKA]|eukprot:XP_034423580.1 conserved protein, unknown function [Plasmodium berghei ANKA]
MNYLALITIFVSIVLLYEHKIKCLYAKDETLLKGNLKILSGNINEKITLKCEQGEFIHILDASYGNPKIDNFLIKKNPLDAPHTLPVVQMLCEGKENCDMNVTNDTFRILSIIKDFHRLIIKYSCILSKPKQIPLYNIKATRGDNKIWNVEFQGEELNKNLYLHVNNINAICDTPLLKKNYVDIDEAKFECDTINNCVYIIFNNGGYTLCESPSYKNATIQKNSKIYIKMSYINGNIPDNYEIVPNIQGVCEKNEIIYEMKSVLRVDEVYEKCKEINCDYFTFKRRFKKFP